MSFQGLSRSAFSKQIEQQLVENDREIWVSRAFAVETLPAVNCMVGFGDDGIDDIQGNVAVFILLHCSAAQKDFDK
jgi:hypothetical protein